MCNISLMKNYLKLSNIIIVLLFISWELNAQVALPSFHAVHVHHSLRRVIAGGIWHHGAILANGTVKFWGYNTNGQLGQGNTNNIGDGSNEMGDNLSAIDLGTGRTATEIVGGYHHSMALLDNSTVKAWGYSNSGQLGQGNANHIGDGSNEMGDNLSVIDLSSSSDVTLD